MSRIKIKWHFPDIKIILLVSYRCCSREIFQRREKIVGKNTALREWWRDFLQPRGCPVQFWLHYVGLITKVFICTGVTLIGMRGNKKSSIWKWISLYRHKGFHCLLRIDRWEGFNVRNQWWWKDRKQVTCGSCHLSMKGACEEALISATLG